MDDGQLALAVTQSADDGHVIQELEELSKIKSRKKRKKAEKLENRLMLQNRVS